MSGFKSNIRSQGNFLYKKKYFLLPFFTDRIIIVGVATTHT